MTKLEIRLFGAIEIRHQGTQLTDFRSQKALALLAYLICSERPVTREQLAGLAWPDTEQSQALGLLRRTLHDLTSKLPACLVVDRHTVHFQPVIGATIDVHTFARQAAQADPTAWAAAVALYRAPFLEGIYLDNAPELENWLLYERERWQGAVVNLLNRLVTYHTAQAAYGDALTYAQKLLRIEPWSEETHRQVMLLQARLGQTSAALAQYERCRQLLCAELAVEPAQETERLRARLAAIAQRTAYPLPPATTSFIGRREEVVKLMQLLAAPANRLITLVGPGGMGKTRLALEVARTVVTGQQRIFLHGVVFVPLVGVETLPQTVAALAQALAFPLQSQGAPETQLLHYLRDKELLLVLDNLEQLVTEPLLAFVRQLLDGAPDLKLLITSRVRLNLQAEQLYWMQGLSVPVTTAATATLPVADIASYSGVQLFLTTVQRSRPHYKLARADGPAVLAICQLVQGMPLALELAATWMNVLSPAEIAAELTRNLDFLASDQHDLPLRQRSMRAVFETSWRLLTAAEQRVFQQLAVFRSSFTREAAQAVTGVSLAGLMSLIHKSFLQQRVDGRYQIHELLRQFGEEKLAETPTLHMETQDRHSDYYLTFVTQRAAGLQGSQQAVLLNEISQEIDNIRHSWLWAAAQGNFDLIEQTLEGFYDYYQTRSQQSAGIEAFTQTIYLLEQQTTHATSGRLRNRLQARHGALCWSFGNYEQAYTLLQASLQIARKFQDNKEMAFCLEFLGRTVWRKGSAAAVRFLEESLALSNALHNQTAVATTLHTLASVFDNLSEKPKARQLAEQSLIISRQLNHPHRIAWAYHRLGTITRELGEYHDSIYYFQEALTAFRQVDDGHNIVQTLAELGHVLYIVGEFPHKPAMDLLREAATRARELGSYDALFIGIGAYASVSTWIGDCETGERCGQELVALSPQMPPQTRATCLAVLADAELALNKLALARQHLLEAMADTLKSQTRLLVNCSRILYAWAELLARECNQPEAALQPLLTVQKRSSALEILSSIIHQPIAWHFYTMRAKPFALQLTEQLPMALATAAEARGKVKTLPQFVTEIIAQEALPPDLKSLQPALST